MVFLVSVSIDVLEGGCGGRGGNQIGDCTCRC